MCRTLAVAGRALTRPRDRQPCSHDRRHDEVVERPVARSHGSCRSGGPLLPPRPVPSGRWPPVSQLPNIGQASMSGPPPASSDGGGTSTCAGADDASWARSMAPVSCDAVTIVQVLRPFDTFWLLRVPSSAPSLI